MDDAVWERAFEGYAPGEQHQSEVVHDVDAASAHVVAAAVGRDAVVRYAGCGDFVWVRVEGGARTQDVLIAGAASPRANDGSATPAQRLIARPSGGRIAEESCQAAPTAH